jgi:hypothetical protein
MNHPPYNPDLSPSDFHLFGLMKVHPGRQKFHIQMQCPELALQSGYNHYAAGISYLPGWKKCVSVKGNV